MLEDIPVLSLIVWLPLLGSLFVLLMPKNNGGAVRAIGIIFSFLPLLLAVGLYASYEPLVGGGAYAEHGTWLSVPLNLELIPKAASYRLDFDYRLGVDGISLPLVLLTGVVAAMASLASVHIRKRWKTYYALFLLLQTGIYGVFLVRDVTLFFIFFELTLIPMFYLIGIWGYYGREKAATRFLVYNGLGSALMLIAFLILIATLGFQAAEVPGGMEVTYSGSYDVMLGNLANAADPAHLAGGVAYLSPNLKWAAFVLLLIAFGVKLPFFPFHTWMLKVHAEAPPPVVMIHSGVLLKMGVYGLIRFNALLFPAQLHSWSTVIAILGVVNILYGAILACAQKEFKLVLAYSSISHMGIVLLGIASLNETGLEGAVYQAVSHGLISSLMFLIVGSLYERTGTTRIDELGGLARSLPFTAGILLTAGLASLGLPGLSGFIGEFLSFLGLFGSLKTITVIGIAGILFAAVYILRSVLSITYGPLPERFAGLREARFIESLPMVVLTALIVLLGIYPSLLTDLMQHGFDGLLRELQTGVGG